MNISINGQSFDISTFSKPTIKQALGLFLDTAQLQQTFAVALNGDFVSKDNYHTTPVHADDKLDVVFPIQGG